MNGFTNIAEYNGPSKNRRDALSSVGQGLTSHTTHISLPQNQPRSKYNPNPYSNRARDYLHGPRHTNDQSRQAGNPLLAGGPPLKRKKLDDTFRPFENGIPQRALGPRVRTHHETSPSITLSPLALRPVTRSTDGSDTISPPKPSTDRSRSPLGMEQTTRSAFHNEDQAGDGLQQTVKTKPMQTAFVEHYPEMTSMTQFKNARPAAPKAGPSQVAMLPVRQWILGHKHFDEPYYVTWDKSGKLTIKRGGDPAKKSFHTEVLDCGAAVKSITLSKVPTSREGPVLKMETHPASKSTFGNRYSDSFAQGGNRNKGSVTLMFDAANEAWSGTRFDEFSAWLTSHVEDSSFVTGSSAAKALWEVASRCAQISNAAATSLERNSISVSSSGSNNKPSPGSTNKPPPRKRAMSIEEEDDWEPPLKVMFPRNDADAPSKAAPQSITLFSAAESGLSVKARFPQSRQALPAVQIQGPPSNISHDSAGIQDRLRTPCHTSQEPNMNTPTDESVAAPVTEPLKYKTVSIQTEGQREMTRKVTVFYEEKAVQVEVRKEVVVNLKNEVKTETDVKVEWV